MKATVLVVMIVIERFLRVGHLQRQRGAVTAAVQKHLSTYIALFRAARASSGVSATKHNICKCAWPDIERLPIPDSVCSYFEETDNEEIIGKLRQYGISPYYAMTNYHTVIYGFFNISSGVLMRLRAYLSRNDRICTAGVIFLISRRKPHARGMPGCLCA
ncbi:MAG: hypothetical protein P1V21_14340 [Rhizobiaceae bacterium]|nr:hypothetical protein [Rhizobiaceae bacterium]